MARAEVVSSHHEKAMEMYTKVIQLNTEFALESEYELKTLQDIMRVISLSRFAKYVAFAEQITRADLAALFKSELRLERIFQKNTNGTNTEYQVPNSQKPFKTKQPLPSAQVVDIEGHPLEGVIREVIQHRINGLGTDPAHRFHPDKVITRAEFAMLIQGILIRIINDPKLATKFLDDPSPFPDVRNDVYYYNAARLIINRGLMEVKDKSTGAFKPLDPIKGVESLLALKDLKNILKRYQY